MHKGDGLGKIGLDGVFKQEDDEDLVPVLSKDLKEELLLKSKEVLEGEVSDIGELSELEEMGEYERIQKTLDKLEKKEDIKVEMVQD
jgi:hypothetical protein